MCQHAAYFTHTHSRKTISELSQSYALHKYAFDILITAVHWSLQSYENMLPHQEHKAICIRWTKLLVYLILSHVFEIICKMKGEATWWWWWWWWWRWYKKSGCSMRSWRRNSLETERRKTSQSHKIRRSRKINRILHIKIIMYLRGKIAELTDIVD